MPPDVLQTITAYIAISIPASIAIANIAKIALEWLKQQHVINTSRIGQTHQITTHYLDKALDPNVPLAIRHQLLRFLSTPDKHGSRLNDWAKAELGRVEAVVRESDKAVAQAEKELLQAKTPTDVAAAETKLASATSKRRSLLEAPATPPISPEALRAGLIKETNLAGLALRGSNLRKTELDYRDLQGADFTETDFTDGSFQGSDLRGASFVNAILADVSFYAADLRATNFSGADLSGARFRQARLESADFSRAILNKTDLRATYDEHTIWPEGFDPNGSGAVKLSQES